MRNLILAAAAAVVLGSPAAAATVVFDFDDLALGSSVGAYNGAVFTNFLVQTGFGETSEPNFAYNSEATALMDFGSGFTSLSFTAGVFSASTVSIYGGVGGSGALLGAVNVVSPPADPFAFVAYSINGFGVGRSVVVVSSAGDFGWDDVTLSTGAVPEPATWALLIAGFGLVGVSVRRRRSIAA